MTAEADRLLAEQDKNIPWKKWGPYLSERQWGTVREDYGTDGNAWDYFSHSQAMRRAYRWGEDGLAGICDDRQNLCFALALWNGEDPMLKERIFGLTNSQGNHGEDAKDYYFYLDSTPTHSYMKYLYKYPQRAFPYEDIVNANGNRGFSDKEYELLDTGVFDDDRYYDVFVEYAKAGPEDILIRITIANQGPDINSLRVLPHLWFRNTWSWGKNVTKPQLKATANGIITAACAALGTFTLYCEGAPPILVTENETNNQALFGGTNMSEHTKDGIHEYVVNHRQDAVAPDGSGTKSAADYTVSLDPGKKKILRLRLIRNTIAEPFGANFDKVFGLRIAEADAFYNALSPPALNQDEKQVMRQSLAGMLWSKQYYEYDVEAWIAERGKTTGLRNTNWTHMKHHDIISMPDKWEYPWYAVWDLAFHTIALMLVDINFAKEQLSLFLSDRYLHPSGQIPAYEWNFSDVNPPVHAWAVYTVYNFDKQGRNGKGDLGFLKYAFDRLCRNFNWWVDQKDPEGKNVFEGGFLGLDNIGVFDRSSELPTGGRLEQSDGTAWMAFYAQNMLTIAMELACHDSSYENDVLIYFDYFLNIASAMDREGENVDEMWDEADGFYYDVLRFPDGTGTRIKIRSLVGLLPLCSVSIIEEEVLQKLPRVKERYETIVREKATGLREIACPDCPGLENRRILAVLDDDKLSRVLACMLDENEFLGPYGIRSLSRFHAENPYTFYWGDQQFTVRYLPGESESGMFGGNSNWRGPVWMPANLLIIRALLNFYTYYGDKFTIECPTGSGRPCTLYQVAKEIADRLLKMFLLNDDGRRPIYGETARFQADSRWRDFILFYEYFHGENGAGVGASHQTGWTGTVALLLALFGSVNSQEIKKGGMMEVAGAIRPEPGGDRDGP